MNDLSNVPLGHGSAARTAPHWLTEVLLLGGFIALGVWAAPDIAAWVRTWLPAPAPAAAAVQTSARIQCPRPSELETLLVFVNVSAEGQVRLECGPVGPRGAYVKEARR